MVRGTPGRGRHHACEPQGAKIEIDDEGVDNASGILLIDEIVERGLSECCPRSSPSMRRIPPKAYSIP